MTPDDRISEQLAKLAYLEDRAQDLMDRPHYHLHEGETVRGPDGEPLRDDSFTLRGMDVQLGVLKLRAQILGYDAPQRLQLVDDNGNTLDVAEADKLLRKLGLTPGED